MRSKLIAVALGSFAIALVACGGSSGSDGDGRAVVADRALVADARQETIDSESARIAGRVSIDGSTFMELDGIADFRTGASEVTMTVPLSDLDPSQSDLVVTILGVGEGTAYGDLGPIVTLPVGKRWVSFTVDDALSPEEIGGGANPASGLAFLEGVVGDPRRVGTDTVRGVETTRYDVTVNLDDLLDRAATQAGRLDPVIERQLRRLLPSLDQPAVDGEVWIDSAGRVRRFDYVLEVESLVETTTTFEFFDFGAAVEVSPPPPEEVVPYADVADQLSQLLTGVVPS